MADRAIDVEGGVGVSTRVGPCVRKPEYGADGIDAMVHLLAPEGELHDVGFARALRIPDHSKNSNGRGPHRQDENCAIRA